jgi:hypothetical protein
MRELLKNIRNPADLLSLTADEPAWAMLEAMQRRAKIPTNSKAELSKKTIDIRQAAARW